VVVLVGTVVEVAVEVGGTGEAVSVTVLTGTGLGSPVITAGPRKIEQAVSTLAKVRVRSRRLIFIDPPCKHIGQGNDRHRLSSKSGSLQSITRGIITRRE
jgi:hypothetical protein